MAINTTLSDRVRAALSNAANVTEKKMFSGLAFLVDEKLCICVRRSDIMCRINPEIEPALVSRQGISLMEMKGRPLKGYITVQEDILTDDELNYWVEHCLEFNKIAKSSRKKT